MHCQTPAIDRESAYGQQTARMSDPPCSPCGIAALVGSSRSHERRPRT